LNNKNQYSVSAVVVVYNDYQSLIELVGSISRQVDAIFIIDNSDIKLKISDVVLNQPNVKYHWLGQNKGLATGLNEGIRLCQKHNSEWVLLLDQDSIVSEDMVACMLDEYGKNTNAVKIGMLCPDVFLSDKGIHQYPLYFGSYMVNKVTDTSDHVDFAITSGSLIKLSLFDTLGYMDEMFFIDYIDYDFCLKLRSRGYKILYVRDASLKHKLGDVKTSKIGILYTSHLPKRIYYQTRNRLIVVRRYGVLFPSFAIMQLMLFVLKFFKILVIEDKKGTRLRCYFAGIRDFFHEKSLPC